MQQRPPLLNKKWPTDKCNFQMHGYSLGAEIKRQILAEPPCQPKSDFGIEQVDGHRFQTSLYNNVSSSGICVHRRWLQYSTHTQEAYCLACWLFGPPFIEKANATSAWQTGYQAFSHTKQSVERHEGSAMHLKSAMDMKGFLSKQGLDAILAKQRHAEEHYWREVIKRVIDVVVYTKLAPSRSSGECGRHRPWLKKQKS